MAVPLTSFSTTIGILVTGSTIKPRIFISTSMLLPYLTLGVPVSEPHSIHEFPRQRVGARACHPRMNVLAEKIAFAAGFGRRRVQEIERLVLRSAADPLAGGFVESLHQTLLDSPHVCGVAADLNVALEFLDDRQAPDLLFLGD